MGDSTIFPAALISARMNNRFNSLHGTLSIEALVINEIKSAFHGAFHGGFLSGFQRGGGRGPTSGHCAVLNE